MYHNISFHFEHIIDLCFIQHAVIVMLLNVISLTASGPLGSETNKPNVNSKESSMIQIEVLILPE